MGRGIWGCGERLQLYSLYKPLTFSTSSCSSSFHTFVLCSMASQLPGPYSSGIYWGPFPATAEYPNPSSPQSIHFLLPHPAQNSSPPEKSLDLILSFHCSCILYASGNTTSFLSFGLFFYRDSGIPTQINWEFLWPITWPISIFILFPILPVSFLSSASCFVQPWEEKAQNLTPCKP